MPLRLHPVTTLRGGGDSFAQKCTVRLPIRDYLLFSAYYINAITLAFFRVFMRHPNARIRLKRSAATTKGEEMYHASKTLRHEVRPKGSLGGVSGAVVGRSDGGGKP